MMARCASRRSEAVNHRGIEQNRIAQRRSPGAVRLLMRPQHIAAYPAVNTVREVILSDAKAMPTASRQQVLARSSVVSGIDRSEARELFAS